MRTEKTLVGQVLASELESDAPEQSRRVRFVAKLTSELGVVLLILLAVEGISVPATRQLFTWHIVVGVLIIPVLAAKIAVTSYRFLLYYSKTLDFQKAGPPWTPLRVAAPLIIVATIALMASGVMLLIQGPNLGNHLWSTVHRASFIVWFALMAVHVLAYVRRASTTTYKDLIRLRSKDSKRTEDIWFRIIIVTVTVAVGVGLSTRFGTSIAQWHAFFSTLGSFVHH